MLYNLPEVNTQYTFINIISGDTKPISDIYPDDTNRTVLNKICLNLCKDTKILTDEICAFTNDYNMIGFDYDKNIKINQIFNKYKINKLPLKDYIDYKFVDDMGNKRSILRNNKLHELFENNFPIDKNTIYYFTYKELESLQEGINDKFIYSVVYKYFPKITKKYITEYDIKLNSDLRKDNYTKINTLISNTNPLIDILYENKDNHLQEQIFINNLLKLSFEKEDNYINIIKLFSDIPLGSKYVLTKLILDEYENTFYPVNILGTLYGFKGNV